MLGLEDFMTIQALVKRGVYLCDIAEQLGVHPKTVSRAVQRGAPPAGAPHRHAVDLRRHRQSFSFRGRRHRSRLNHP